MEFSVLFNSIPPTTWQEKSGDWKQKRFHLLVGLQEEVCWPGVGTRAAALLLLLPLQKGTVPLWELFLSVEW